MRSGTALAAVAAALLACTSDPTITEPSVTSITAKATRGYTAVDLGTLGGRNGFARAINAAGQIVGEAETVAGFTHAFLWSHGVMTDLGTLGGNLGYELGTQPQAINPSGQVARYGYPTFSSIYHAALWNGGAVIDLGTLVGEPDEGRRDQPVRRGSGSWHCRR